jgi:hypothetical protein
MTLDEKISLADAQLAMIMPNINEGDFITIINGYPGLKEYMTRINDERIDAKSSYLFIDELFSNNEITLNEKLYFYKIADAYENYLFDFENLKHEIENVKTSVINDQNLTEDEIYNLKSVLNIVISSVEFWGQNQGYLKNSKGLPWYEADFFGAMAGVQSGLVGWATSVGGPWGGAAALVGTVAVGSMLD